MTPEGSIAELSLDPTSPATSQPQLANPSLSVSPIVSTVPISEENNETHSGNIYHPSATVFATKRRTALSVSRSRG